MNRAEIEKEFKKRLLDITSYTFGDNSIIASTRYKEMETEFLEWFMSHRLPELKEQNLRKGGDEFIF